jgi:CO/xanthine dehydrogenase FAD-binding subunit
MQGSISNRSCYQPKSLKGALMMMRDEGPLVPMAGCTDLYVSLNFGTLAGTRFLNLWPLETLRTIEIRGGVLFIGALATHTDLIRSPLVARRIPMLAAAAREIGGVQIQNRGTLGGNVANGSPAGDTLPVLAAVDATVVLGSAGGTRRVPFTAFYTGYRQSVRRPDELIVGFEIPPITGTQWFRKVGTRAAQAISKIVVAGVAPVARSSDARRSRGSDVSAGTVRIALGSVGPTVIRATRTEEALARGALLADAQRILIDEIAPIDDIRSTAEYRRRVASNLLARFWTDTQRR